MTKSSGIRCSRHVPKKSTIYFVTEYKDDLLNIANLIPLGMSVKHRLGFGFTIPFFFSSFRKNNWYESLGPTRTYPDIKESATFSFRIQKFPRPQVSVFKSNLPVHTLVPGTPLGILATEHASSSARNFAFCSALSEPGNEVAILNIVFTVKNWFDLVTSPDKNIFIYILI